MKNQDIHYRKNVVYVGFSEEEKNTINEKLIFFGIKRRKINIIFEDNLKDGLKHQGKLIVIRMKKFDYDFKEYDIDNRHFFKNFDYVCVCTNNSYIKSYFDCWYSKISIINISDIIRIPRVYIGQGSGYYLSKKRNNIKMTAKRRNNVDMLHNYLIRKRKYLKTKDIASELNVSIRWVERYMKDLIYIYGDIGYDKKEKTWYICKQR